MGGTLLAAFAVAGVDGAVEVAMWDAQLEKPATAVAKVIAFLAWATRFPR